MHVHVLYGLSRVWANVENAAETGLINTLDLGDLRDDMHKMPQHLFGNVFGQFVEMLFGDNKRVYGSFWLDIIECIAEIIFVDFLGRDLACDDFAK